MHTKFCGLKICDSLAREKKIDTVIHLFKNEFYSLYLVKLYKLGRFDKWVIQRSTICCRERAPNNHSKSFY